MRPRTWPNWWPLFPISSRVLRFQAAVHKLAQLDHRHIWHPFTQMRDWFNREPIVIVSGKGALLRDARGRDYLDANSSIWTNLHGHNHPRINAALRRQLKKIAHSSALGLANEPASLLAERLVQIANWQSPIANLKSPGGSENASFRCCAGTGTMNRSERTDPSPRPSPLRKGRGGI